MVIGLQLVSNVHNNGKFKLKQMLPVIQIEQQNIEQSQLRSHNKMQAKMQKNVRCPQFLFAVHAIVLLYRILNISYCYRWH